MEEVSEAGGSRTRFWKQVNILASDGIDYADHSPSWSIRTHEKIAERESGSLRSAALGVEDTAVSDGSSSRLLLSWRSSFRRCRGVFPTWMNTECTAQSEVVGGVRNNWPESSRRSPGLAPHGTKHRHRQRPGKTQRAACRAAAERETRLPKTARRQVRVPEKSPPAGGRSAARLADAGRGSLA